MQTTEKIWMNGELVDWDDARIHVGTHGLHYGSGVFEGIRCYETTGGPAVFRLTDHLQRLLTAETVWLEAGSPRHVLGLDPGVLTQLTRAIPADLTQEG